MTIKEIIEMKDPLEPETLIQLFPNLSKTEREKIMAIKVIRDTEFVFKDMDVFENAVHVLNDVEPNISVMQGCTPEQIWYAILKIKTIRPKAKYSDEVKEYIKFIFKDNGYNFYPEIEGIENLNIKKYIDISKEGPFPLSETPDNIQALKYMKLMEYSAIKDKK